MTWRHFLLIAVVGAMLVINGVLLFFEEVNLSVSGSGPVDRISDPLIAATFSPTTRVSNFKAFGLPDDMAEEARGIAGRMYDDNERLKIMLNDGADVLTQYFCSASGVPQRYAALNVLVTQRDLGGGVLERKVIDWRRTTSIQVEDWAITSRIDEVYNAVELTERRHSDSTAMGIGAVLGVREDDLFEQHAPVGTIRWSFRKLLDNDPSLRAKLVDYFALMHVLTELAQSEDGICRWRRLSRPRSHGADRCVLQYLASACRDVQRTRS